MTMSERIRAIRKRKGLTQKEVAQRCGMADSAIRKYESGSVTPKFDTMDRIARALEVPVTALMGYEFQGVDADGKDIYAPPAIQTIEASPIGTPNPVKKEVKNSLRDQLLESFDSLNRKGQRIALERIDELAEIPKYQKEKPPQD